MVPWRYAKCPPLSITQGGRGAMGWRQGGAQGGCTLTHKIIDEDKDQRCVERIKMILFVLQFVLRILEL